MKKRNLVIKKAIENEYTYEEFNLKEKIEYYRNRATDKSLTSEQRFYIAKKVEMLTTGIGRIYLTNDRYLTSVDSSDAYIKGDRRVLNMVDCKNGHNLVAGIYSFDKNKVSKGLMLEVNNSEASVLHKKSGVNIKLLNVKKKYLKETTSTISPFQIDDINNFVYNNKIQKNRSKRNRNLRNKYNRPK